MTFKRQQERTCEARTVQKVTLILPIKAKEKLTFMQKTGRLVHEPFWKNPAVTWYQIRQRALTTYVLVELRLNPG